MYAYINKSACGGQRCWIPQHLGFNAGMSYLIWVFGIELGSFGRERLTLALGKELAFLRLQHTLTVM